MRRLNLEGDSLSPDQKQEIEKKIQEDKATLNLLLSEQKIAQAKYREEKSSLSVTSSTSSLNTS